MKTQGCRSLPVAGLGAVLDCYGDTHVGLKRANNEDAYLCVPELGLFIVCDGVGGRAHGEVASAAAAELIHEWVRDNLPECRRLPTAKRQSALRMMLSQALQRASYLVRGMGLVDPDLRGMSTTAAVLLIDKDIATLAHVGDSRIYLLRHQEAKLLTEDHTLGRVAQRQGLLSAESAARLRTISEAVGLRDDVEVDLRCMQLLPGDRFMLCTDGLHEHLSTLAQVAKLMSVPLKQIVQQAIALAIECGGADNITALVVEHPTPTPTPTHR